MWAHGSRSGAKLFWLALALWLLALPLSSWAAPSVEEALKALSLAEAALAKAQDSLTLAQAELTASKGASVRLQETVDKLTLELETLKGVYATRLKELEALKTQSAELSSSLKASQADLLTADRWAAGLGLGMLLAVLGWIFL